MSRNIKRQRLESYIYHIKVPISTKDIAYEFGIEQFRVGFILNKSPYVVKDGVYMKETYWMHLKQYTLDIVRDKYFNREFDRRDSRKINRFIKNGYYKTLDDVLEEE